MDCPRGAVASPSPTFYPVIVLVILPATQEAGTAKGLYYSANPPGEGHELHVALAWRGHAAKHPVCDLGRALGETGLEAGGPKHWQTPSQQAQNLAGPCVLSPQSLPAASLEQLPGSGWTHRYQRGSAGEGRSEGGTCCGPQGAEE